jgi:hypothetical protein
MFSEESILKRNKSVYIGKYMIDKLNTIVYYRLTIRW